MIRKSNCLAGSATSSCLVAKLLLSMFKSAMQHIASADRENQLLSCLNLLWGSATTIGLSKHLLAVIFLVEQLKQISICFFVAKQTTVQSTKRFRMN